jgi:CRISPR system Cascade subunit CasE
MSNTSFLSMVPVHEVFNHRPGFRSRSELNSPRALHTAVMNFFPALDSGRPRETGGVLFRIEPAVGELQREEMILIRSKIKPVHNLEGMITKELNALSPETGTQVSFRLTVNAIQRKTLANASGGQTRHGRPVRRDDDTEGTGIQMTEWLQGKLAGALTDVEILDHTRSLLGGGKANAQAPQHYVSTDLVDGFAVVQDQEKLEDLMSAGVGRSKAYGCGLLTVRAI